MLSGGSGVGVYIGAHVSCQCHGAADFSSGEAVDADGTLLKMPKDSAFAIFRLGNQ